MIYYQKNSQTSLLFLCTFCLILQAMIGFLYHQNFLIYTSPLYGIIFLLLQRFYPKKIILALNPKFLTIEKDSYSWNLLKTVRFIVQSENQTIYHFISFEISELPKPILLKINAIENFDKNTFLTQIQHFQELFEQEKEAQKQGFSLSPIEKEMNIQYPILVKEYLENLFIENKTPFFSFLNYSFEFISPKLHTKIIELSKKMSELTQVQFSVNSLVIAQQKNHSTGILFLSNVNNDMKKGTDLRIFYHDFNRPEFQAIQLSYTLFDIINPLKTNYLINYFQLIDGENPEEKGFFEWKESANNQMNWNWSYDIKTMPFGSQITIQTEMNLCNLSIAYESIFMDYEKKHLPFYQKNEPIITFILYNLTLSHLKFAQAGWLKKGQKISDWNDCLNTESITKKLKINPLD